MLKLKKFIKIKSVAEQLGMDSSELGKLLKGKGTKGAEKQMDQATKKKLVACLNQINVSCIKEIEEL